MGFTWLVRRFSVVAIHATDREGMTMDAAEFRSFKVWLGFVAVGLAILLILIAPAPTRVEVVITESYGWRADGTWGPMAPATFKDLTPVHPLLHVAAACVALGWAWWFYWLYRRHQELARSTNSTYPIGPGKAVGFHFVPVFNLYWAFYWTRPFTRFCDEAERGLKSSGPPGKGNPGWLPGAFMSLAILFAYGAIIPRSFLFRVLGGAPTALSDILASLITVLVVATLLDRRLVSAAAMAGQSSGTSTAKSTLGI